MRILIVGHGRMGTLVEFLCLEYGGEVAGIVDRPSASAPEAWPAADVAVDFSTADAAPVNLRRLAARGTPVVIGTTGWQAHEAEMKRVAAAAGIGVVAAANFAPGVAMFTAIVERAAELMARRDGFGAWVHEMHHATKRDAPSGTALALERAMRGRGFDGPIDIASTRAGFVPGTHTVGFDAPSESIAMTHTTRDRAVFARGALDAARWVVGKRGWFGMRDVLDM